MDFYKFIRYSDAQFTYRVSEQQTNCLLFRYHLNNGPFKDRTTFNYLKTRLVWNSDLHCMLSNAHHILVSLFVFQLWPIAAGCLQWVAVPAAVKSCLTFCHNRAPASFHLQVSLLINFFIEGHSFMLSYSQEQGDCMSPVSHHFILVVTLSRVSEGSEVVKTSFICIFW